MYNIAFCDDNTQFLKQFADTVRKQCELIMPGNIDYEIGPRFSSAKAVMSYLKNNSIDLLFLDIDMPDINGFELAREICNYYKNITIVFVSSYDNFVYSSFEFNPFAYLRKSHIESELEIVLHRIVDQMLLDDKKIVLNTTDGNKVFLVKNILYFESISNYFKICCTDNTEYLCRGTLTQLEKLISSYDFYRIHSAYIVNLENINSICEKSYVVVKNGHKIPIAQKRLSSFRKTYMEYTRKCLGL